MPRSDLPSAWDERSVLMTFLNYARQTAVDKCTDLADSDAAKAPLPDSPLMTVAGVLNHLRWVEAWWFEVVLLGHEDRAPWTDEDPDREFRIATEMPIAQVVSEYQAQWARVDELIADLPLDTPAKQQNSRGVHVPLQWVIMHLVEETSRHNGHLDILRELADGTRGS
jgi:uncharacterized damage-inducible protein DinB